MIRNSLPTAYTTYVLESSASFNGMATHPWIFITLQAYVTFVLPSTPK